MRFVFPSLEYKDRAVEFIEEFHAHGQEVNGSGGLNGMLGTSTYEHWLEKVMADIDIANIRPKHVPALTYFYVREEDGRLVGMVNVRLALNEFLRREGGHIGYCIRPTEQRKGYGTMMLRETLEFCRSIGMRDFIITCGVENTASAKVIRGCGGVLDGELWSETFRENLQRYIIP